MLDAKTNLNINLTTSGVEDTRTEAQKNALEMMSQAGMALMIATMMGGTGAKRAEWTDKQYSKNKSRRIMAKRSRKANR